jgi:hypothetical protein
MNSLFGGERPPPARQAQSLRQRRNDLCDGDQRPSTCSATRFLPFPEHLRRD